MTRTSDFALDQSAAIGNHGNNTGWRLRLVLTIAVALVMLLGATDWHWLGYV